MSPPRKNGRRGRATAARPLLPALAAGGLALALLAGGLARRRSRLDFAGKVVVITGGSRGLGLVLARQLAGKGARLALLAREAGDLERARQELAQTGPAVLAIPCDVTNQAQVTEALAQVYRRFGRLDVLINNAGIVQVGPLAHMTTQDFETAMATHFWAPLYTTLAAVHYMRPQGSGRIVNIASIGGKVAVPHLLPYTASKFALVGLSDGLRAELAEAGIRVTTVIPGLMRTGSHVNAFFKGRHRQEFTWFSVSDALPIASTSAESAARQILRACQNGDPQLVITPQARLLVLLNAVFPRFVAFASAVAARLLPAPQPGAGSSARRGWQSQSRWSPSGLTRPADEAARRNNELGEAAG